MQRIIDCEDYFRGVGIERDALQFLNRGCVGNGLPHTNLIEYLVAPSEQRFLPVGLGLRTIVLLAAVLLAMLASQRFLVGLGLAPILLTLADFVSHALVLQSKTLTTPTSGHGSDLAKLSDHHSERGVGSLGGLRCASVQQEAAFED